MKPIKSFVAALLFTSVLGSALAQPASRSEAADKSRDAANYSVRVEWKDAKGPGHHLQVVTAEGPFELSTFLPEKARINDSDIPITVTFQGTLTLIDAEHGRLKLFF